METIFDVNSFFDSFPEFYKTSKTGIFPNRLNNRYLALIDNNKNIISNSSILDIGSHDGRWSFAALKNGASKIIGIEANQFLVKNSLNNMKFYGIPKERYHFITGNIFKEIQKIKPKTIDVVFCFGIFYHIMNHMHLLAEIKKLKPKYLILDSKINPSEHPIIRLVKEDPVKEGTGVQGDFISGGDVVAGLPSKSAIELMLDSLGFEFGNYDWHNLGITNCKGLVDYKNGRRITLVAKNQTDEFKTEFESLDDLYPHTTKLIK